MRVSRRPTVIAGSRHEHRSLRPFVRYDIPARAVRRQRQIDDIRAAIQREFHRFLNIGDIKTRTLAVRLARLDRHDLYVVFEVEGVDERGDYARDMGAVAVGRAVAETPAVDRVYAYDLPGPVPEQHIGASPVSAENVMRGVDSGIYDRDYHGIVRERGKIVGVAPQPRADIFRHGVEPELFEIPISVARLRRRLPALGQQRVRDGRGKA